MTALVTREGSGLSSCGLNWFGIVRLGLVQAALGSIVVLTTSTLNRIMIVELGMAAVIPGLLVGIHYGVQIARPLWGHGSDAGGRRTPWIVGGVALLALSGVGASVAVAVMAEHFALGLILAVLDFVLIGAGIGAAGTSLLALLASRVAPVRRPAAATLVWLMMIFGIAVTGIASGSLLDPFSMERLIAVTAGTGLAALLMTVLAVAGIERGAPVLPAAGPSREPSSFRAGLGDAWRERQARRFTIFVFVSMFAYSLQELILEPFAGIVFAMTPGETTTLSGLQNGAVFAGMLVAGVFGSLLSRRVPSILKLFTVGGCVLSGLSLALLSFDAWGAAGQTPTWPLTANVVALGFANGLFAVAAIASMMALAGAAGPSRVGLRMGLWGAAQAIGFGLGGLAGTVAVDLTELATGSVVASYAGVFAFEGLVFLAAASLALGINVAPKSAADSPNRPRRGLPMRTLGAKGADLQPAE